MDVLGRDGELARIDAWLAAIDAADVSRLLVVEGEAGIGKTTLWAEGVRRARALGHQVMTSRPVSSEAGLPYVALADLLRDVPDDELTKLAPPQGRALRVALLRVETGDEETEPRAVGTGLAALLDRMSAAGRLLLAVDDAQWLDSASGRALTFALRRLDGRPVAAFVAVRVSDQDHRYGSPFADVDSSPARTHLAVGPLSVAAMHQMFRQVLDTSFPRPQLASIHRASAGNPFYALEIAREIQRLGSPPPGQPLPVPRDQRELALLRVRRLPRRTRRVLAELAAMSGASTRDLDLAALAAAEEAGIVAVRPDGRVEFTHPLFGSTLYSSVPTAERRTLHLELADRTSSPQERARHLALAADGPDEATAAALDEAAAVARARGAAEVAVELKDLACRLTEPTDREAGFRRATELADLRYFAGDPTGARRALEGLLTSLPAGNQRAQVLVELGSMRWVQGEADAGMELMIRALAEADAPTLRARIHARIASAADDADVAVQHGEAALALLDERADPQLYSYALHVFAMFKLHAGHGADHAAIEKGMRLQREALGFDVSPVPAFWARIFDDFTSARQRLEDLIRIFREQGEDAQLAGALTHLTGVERMTGHLDRAGELADEALDLARQTEQQTYIDMALTAKAHVRAQAGDLAEATAIAEELLGRLEPHPDLVLEEPVREVLGLAALTRGDLAEADRQLTRADEINELIHNREPANHRFHPDHVEAVIGLGELDRAERLVGRLEARAAALPRPWIEAVSARCRGMLNAALGELDGALADYQRAVEAHEHLDMPGEHGRTLLALGRLRRRRGERQLARQSLEQAVRVLESAGALGWAAVARAELGRASGRRGTPEQLTPTERTIAGHAASGLRNQEIAARLYVSQKTVEANLSRAYRKLGVRSRTELAAALRGAPDSET